MDGHTGAVVSEEARHQLKTFKFTKVQGEWEFTHATHDENGDDVNITMRRSAQIRSWNPIQAFWEFILKLFSAFGYKFEFIR